MVKWLHILLPVAISAVILALILFIILKRCFRPKNVVFSDIDRAQNGIARLRQVSPLHHHHHHHLNTESSKKPLSRPGIPIKNQSFFSWADHPSLVTAAVENGWSGFAFTTFMSSPSVKSLFGPCGGGPENENTKLETSWEVCEGSAELMQKIRLNPDNNNNNISVIRAGLPLPGPNLGFNSSFPQEAYFEITVLYCDEDDRYDQLGYKKKRGKLDDGDKIKLIGQNFDAMDETGSLSSVSRGKMDDWKQEGENDDAWLSVGLTRGGELALRIPGTYTGSIGFNSTGSVYLDGTKLVSESESNERGISNKVIGCGYSPSQKKVFFTSNAQLVHEIHCKTEEFASPLYPTIAANNEITVLVNLGQSPFRYTPANQQRTTNPCFIGRLGTSPALGYEDSRELFSMGRIDSQWLQMSANRSYNNRVNSMKGLEYDMESDGDLFEIVLERSGRSPYATMH